MWNFQMVVWRELLEQVIYIRLREKADMLEICWFELELWALLWKKLWLIQRLQTLTPNKKWPERYSLIPKYLVFGSASAMFTALNISDAPPNTLVSFDNRGASACTMYLFRLWIEMRLKLYQILYNIQKE